MRWKDHNRWQKQLRRDRKSKEPNLWQKQYTRKVNNLMLNRRSAKKCRLVWQKNKNNKRNFNNLKEESIYLLNMQANKVKILCSQWRDVLQSPTLKKKLKARMRNKKWNKRKGMQETKLKHWKYYQLNKVDAQILLWKLLTVIKKITLRKNEILIINAPPFEL